VRGCLFVVLLAGVVLTAAAWFGAPPLAALVVRNALTSAGVASGTIDVQVEASPPLRLLSGRADRVRIRATDATVDRMVAATLDLELSSVDLFSRSFGSIDGTLSDVAVPAGVAGSILARSIALVGPADAVVATVHVERAAAEAAFTAALARAVGQPVGAVRLAAPDQLTFSLGPVSASARLVVDDAGLVLEADVPGRPRVVVLNRGDPLVVRSVAIADDLVIVGTLDGSDWLRSASS
jgi:hypothetical protein